MNSRAITKFVLAALCVVLPAVWFAGASVVDRGPIRERVRAADAEYERGVAQSADAKSDLDASRESFRAAARAYEAAQSESHLDTAALAYNLGNARLRAGELPGAIAAYRRALVLDPSDARALHNLEQARRQVQQRVAPPAPSRAEILRDEWFVLGASSRMALTLTLWSLGFALLTLAVLGTQAELAWRKPASLRRAGLALIALAVIVGATVVGDTLAVSGTDLAVISQQSTLRKGNGDGFEPAVAEPLPLGTECRVGESRPGWTEVELGDRTRGWIKDDAVIRVAR